MRVERSADARSVVAKALTHATRRAILREIWSREELSPTSFASARSLNLGAASYHFRRLKALGILSLARTVPKGGSIVHVYQLTTNAEILTAIGALLPVSPDREWQLRMDAASHDELQDRLAKLMTELEARADEAPSSGEAVVVTLRLSSLPHPTA